MFVKIETISKIKQLTKLHVDRLIDIENQMMFFKKFFVIVRFMESQLVELDERVDGINVMSARLDKLPIKELIFRVDSL